MLDTLSLSETVWAMAGLAVVLGGFTVGSILSTRRKIRDEQRKLQERMAMLDEMCGKTGRE